jgi:hypothetical protein
VRPKRIIAISAALAVGLIAIAGYRLARRMESPSAHGLSLGMSPADARAAFRPGTRGRFVPQIAAVGSDTELTWNAIVTVPNRPIAATLDFRGGRLAQITLVYPATSTTQSPRAITIR